MCSQHISAQQNRYDALSTIQDASKRFSDSLIAKGVDTLISYYFGYAACPSASSPVAFIYWSHKGSSQVVIFREVRPAKKKKRYWPMVIYYHECDGIPFSVSYFEHNYDKIALDSPLTSQPGKRTIWVFNHPFEAIDVRVGDLRIKYDIMTSQRNYNPDSYKIAFIDNFRSFILTYFYTNWTLRYVD